MSQFYNLTSKRWNSLKTARVNGLFTNPKGFVFQPDVGLDMKNQRAVSRRTLQQKLRSGNLKPSEVYYLGKIVMPERNVIVNDNKANRKTQVVEAVNVTKKTMVNVLDELVNKKYVKPSELNIDDVDFKGVAKGLRLRTKTDYFDLDKYTTAMRKYVVDYLGHYFDTNGPFKVLLRLGVTMRRQNEGDTLFARSFHSGGEYEKSDGTRVETSMPIVNKQALMKQYDEMLHEIWHRIDEFVQNGSGWIFNAVDYLQIKLIKYAPFKGASYIDLPQWLKNKKCCINVQNEDDRCFEYALLSALHAVKEPKRVSSFKPFIGELNFDGIDFPVEASDYTYELFEKQNGIPINVFTIDAGATSQPEHYELVYVNKLVCERDPVNLLLVTDEEKSHYGWIKNLNAFVRTSADQHLTCCPKCLQRFWEPSRLEKHKKENKCQEYRSEATKVLPEEGKHKCFFENTQKQMMVPFVLYADIESMLLPTFAKKGENTHIYQTHKANHVGVKLVSQYPELLADSYQQFDGEDCVDEFLQYCVDTQNQAFHIVKKNLPMKMTAEEERAFKTAKVCALCSKDLRDDRVRDHDHMTGKYRGACHSKCNINFNYKNFKLPVIFHNLRGYDSHFILQRAGKLDMNVSCIPNTMEKYLSFTIDRCVFIDSLQFTLAGLESLVNNLNKGGDSVFTNFLEEFGNADKSLQTLLRQKGVFPYDWFDSEEKLEVTALPSRESFYSKLNEEEVKSEDYERAELVWEKAGCKTFYDYLSLYLKTDVVLLADVFEAFRAMCMKYYGLDACHYFTAPGFSWDSMLKMTGVEIECFKDGQLDMLQMVQRGMRGGISMISTRFAKANNKYLNDYDPAKVSSYLMYLDANNLYGWAMSQYLPIGDYKWENSDEFDDERILGFTDNQDRGYIFEVDLSVPDNLHDYFNDYPLAPETTLFEPSPIMKELREKLEISEGKVKKLIPNLHRKEKYVLHYRNLKLYLQLGMKLERVERVLSFKQTDYLKKYIDFNTDKRSKSTNDFEKDFFKLLNNAIFGKTCENVDKRIDVKLFTDPKKFVNMASRPYFKNFEIFSNDLVACEMKKTKIVYNRPMIVGMCILDLSKVLMYDFHYNVIKAKYGEKAKLCFTDTDSLTYHIETDDVYDDMKAGLHMYDTSDYPKDHSCYSTVNKKVIGKFKDELNGKPMREFVGLRAKMYSILKDEDKNKATAKGIKKNVIKQLTHEQYKKAVFGSTVDELKQKVSFNLIRSENHKVNTIAVTKTGLCGYDDKRYVLEDNVNTLAHGHWRAR